jgi:3-hydroxyisobutyrate dehydrogenase-like beta-hydroxyacid dehydrogenase
MTIKTVGLIGVGLMGHGIGKNVLAKGFAVNVMAHKNRAPVESLIGVGAKEFKSPAEIAKASQLVILCVTGTPDPPPLLGSLQTSNQKACISLTRP